MSSNVQTIVVTGAASGIGAAIAGRAMDDGLGVVGLDRTAGHHTAYPLVIGDVRDLDAHNECVRRARDLGPLVGWVNSAAIQPPTNLHETDFDVIKDVLDVDLMGYIKGSSVAVKEWLNFESAGSIVNISSAHARAAYPNAMAYDIAKAGVEALTRFTALQYGPHGIRCNAVAPGAVDTPPLAAIVSDDGLNAPTRGQIGATHPLMRIAAPSEIAAVVMFLLSDESSFVSGSVIAADGGLTASCLTFVDGEALVPPLHSIRTPRSRGDASTSTARVGK